MEQGDTGEVLDLLARRAPVLRELAAGPVSKVELQSTLDVSRSTVDRALRALERAEFVERDRNGYRATLCGRVALEAHECFESRLSGVCAMADLLSTLPEDAPFAPAMVAGADVVRPGPADPHRPVEAICEVVEWADHTRGTVLGVSDQFVDVYRESVLDGASLSLVFPPTALQRLLSRYSDGLEAVVSTGRVELRESTETPPFALKIHERDDERVVALAVYGHDGLRALIRNDAPEAVRWAESLFEDIWADADPLPRS